MLPNVALLSKVERKPICGLSARLPGVGSAGIGGAGQYQVEK